MATAESLPCQDQHRSSNSSSSSSSSREGTKPKKLKKLRSVKLIRIPSWKSPTRRPKSQSDQHQTVLSGNMGTPFMPYQIDELTASPNYMKSTSCSDARKENFQASASNSESSSDYDSSRPSSAPAGLKPTRFLESTSTLRPTKTLTRNSSLKSKKPMVKKKVKKSRPTSNTSTSNSQSPTRMSNTPPLYLKAISYSDQKKVRLSGSDERRKNLNNSKLKSTSPVLKSGKVLTKTTSLRPVRILTKMASLRSKKPSMRKCSESAQIPVSGINKATCSSTFKNSNFPKYAEPQPEGSESERISSMKVCPYTYCSLHGHHHGPAIPLKRFVSVRRRLLRSQKSTKPKIRPTVKAKNSGYAKKGIGVNKMTTVQDAAILETANASTAMSPAIGNSSIFINDHPDAVYNFLPELEEAKFGDKVSLKSDDAGNTGNEEVLVDAGEVHEGTISSLSSKYWHGDTDFKGKNSDAADLATMTVDPLDRTTSSTSDDMESTAANSNASSASVRDRFKVLLLQGHPPLEGSVRNRATDIADEPQMEKEKYISMWRLIHHSMSSGKVITQLRPDGGVDKANTSLLENISVQGMGMENLDAGNQKIEFDAIKLVKEAIDEILLPEVQDQSSDARSITSDVQLDEDLQEKNHGKYGEGSISTSINSIDDSLPFDKMKAENGIIVDQKQALLETDNTTTSEQNKTIRMAGSKSNQAAPKNWSKLKKIIIFRRFMKALDKVRNLNFREPRHLPLEPDSEAERVNLRHQTAEERKRAEEWMLDYALRQVVGNLTPTRRRKVELLVEAFETIIPDSGNGTHLRRKAAVSPHTNPSQAHVDNLVEGGTEKEQEHDCRNKVKQGKTSSLGTALLVSPGLKETSMKCCRIETDLEKHNDQAIDEEWKEDRINASEHDNGEENNVTDKQPGLDSHLPELGVPRLYEESSMKQDDVVSTSHEEVPVASRVFEEVKKEIISSSKKDSCDGVNGSNDENLENHDSTAIVGQSSTRTVSLDIDDFQDSTATRTTVSSDSACDTFNVKAAVSKESNRNSEQFNQGFPTPEDPNPECNIHEAYKTQLDKQKYMKMWRVIYQQVVDGSAAKFGSQQHLDRADKGEQVHDTNTPDGAKSVSSLQSLSETDDAVGVKNHSVRQKFNFSQIEAIRLVEKAIDEIVLPEIEEQSSDDQSNTSDIISDKDFLGKNDGEGEKLSMPTLNDSAANNIRKFGQIKPEYGMVRGAGETPLKDDVVAPKQESMNLKIGSRSNQQKPNNWSNLKKLILLNRFVKALEKLREFTPREPQPLPMEPDPEAEKINLRHQTLEERRSAEEWMIDNAIQQVVARLTPARKKRVELLVEAFETVTPLSDTGNTPKHSTGQRLWPMRSP